MSEWISVKAKLPESSVIVLMTVNNVDDTQVKPYVMQGYKEFDTWVILTEDVVLEDENIGDVKYWQVEHWMPQPEPP